MAKFAGKIAKNLDRAKSDKEIPKLLLDTGHHNFLHKEISSVMGSGLTLTNKGIKYIIKVLSLENRGILLKGTTEKIKFWFVWPTSLTSGLRLSAPIPTLLILSFVILNP